MFMVIYSTMEDTRSRSIILRPPMTFHPWERLPPELHLQILEELLRSGSGHIRHAECREARLPNSDLLFVSKDIHDKARVALRNVNILTVDYHTRTSPELLTVDHKAIKYFKHVVLNVRLHRWAVLQDLVGTRRPDPISVLSDLKGLLIDAKAELPKDTEPGKVYLHVKFVPDFVILTRMLVHSGLDYFHPNQNFRLCKRRSDNPIAATYSTDFVQYVMGWLQAQLRHIIVRQRLKWNSDAMLEHIILTSNVEDSKAGFQFLRKDDTTVAFKDDRHSRMGLIICNDLDGEFLSDIMVFECTYDAEASVADI